MAAPSLEVLAVACTRFQAPGWDFLSMPTNSFIPTGSVIWFTDLSGKDKALVCASAGGCKSLCGPNTKSNPFYNIPQE